ncbi:MAG: hypothetical protein OER95_18835 [Acidimicrobiia bacterium]|nr:hypothetical protein [Acidimicrobiia bacterium]
MAVPAQTGGKTISTDTGRLASRTVLSKPALVVAVARRGGPRLFEAMVIPAVLFYVSLVLVGVGMAYLTALAWSYAAVGFRALSCRSVSGVHVMVAVGLSVKTVMAVATGSTFVYFAQPVLGSAVLALVFLGSIVAGRPMIRFLAEDFCPIDAEAGGRHGVALLFRRLTYLWATVSLLKAATTLVLLLTLSLSSFVLIRTLAMWGLTLGAVVATFALSFRAAHAEQLVPVLIAGNKQRFEVTAK